jgi:CRISPR-associated protein Cmr3
MDALWLEKENGGRRITPLQPEPPPRDVRTLGRQTHGRPQRQAYDQARESMWWPRVEEQAKPLPAPRWWSEADFVAWLAGDWAAVATKPPRWAEKPLKRIQARVGIDAETFTALESVLFSHDVIETLDWHDPSERAAEWAIAAELELPGGTCPDLVRLGSDSRIAHVEPLAESVFAPPAKLIELFDNGGQGRKGLRLVVVTPAKFQNGWLPSGFELQGAEFRGQLRGISGEFRLRAAFVPRPLHVSGWNMVGGGRSPGSSRGGGAPKETSRLVPSGAVYFFHRLDGRPFDGEDARKLWLTALGARTDEGFGRVVPGIWDPGEPGPRE